MWDQLLQQMSLPRLAGLASGCLGGRGRMRPPLQGSRECRGGASRVVADGGTEHGLTARKRVNP